jgi:hypothetical protein
VYHPEDFLSKFIHRFRGAAILCAFATLVCELISRPFTTMNVCDDGPYIRMAQTFANTGHIVYNGWAATMMVSQIYLAQPFIKLFGYSFTSVRMSTLPLALITAFFFHRTLVRTGSSERDATLATLAVVISPMYLLLSVTFMTDISGLLGITLCLYGCVRAMQASADRAAIAWICFALASSAVFGTSRQITWLGDLVMVPCTLLLLRSRKRVALAGVAATAVGFLFIAGCMHWLARQSYVVSVPLIVRPFPKRIALKHLSYIILEIPFLVLPVIAGFIPCIFKSRRYTRFLLLAALVAYVGIAFHGLQFANPILHLEPTAGVPGSWVTIYGVFTGLPRPPVLLHTNILIVLTILSIGGLLGVVAVVLQARDVRPSPQPSAGDHLSWKQLGILFVPFSLAYLILLAAAAGTTHAIYDRYVIELLGPTIIVLLRLYRERVQPRLPFTSVLLVLVVGAYGVIATHNNFALDRARVALADELHASGIPFTAIDGGWDYNIDTELQYSNHLNDPRIRVPADAYVVPSPAAPCYSHGVWHELTPHLHAVYGISFLPDFCYGRSQFAPVQYRRWPLLTPINLYAVRYAPSAR